MIDPPRTSLSYGLKSGIFKPRKASVPFHQMHFGITINPIRAEEPPFHHATRATSCGIQYRVSPARPGRCLLAVGAGSRVVDRQHRVRATAGRCGRLAAGCDPAHGLLRTPVPARRHRLRSGADGARRHLNGDRDSRGKPRIPADDDRRSNHPFHARRYIIGRAGRCAGGSRWADHELRSRHPVQRRRQQAGGDGIERVCDAMTASRICYASS